LRDASPQDKTDSKDKSSRNSWLPVAGLVFGVAGLVFIVYFVGVDAILEPLRKIGWGFFLIVALNGARHYLRSVNLYIAVPKAERSFGVRHAMTARLAGETINTIAFTGPLLGDAAKAAILQRKIPIEHSATAVIIDEIIYYVSSLLLILAGAITVLYAYGAGMAVNFALLALVLFSALVFAGILLVVRNDFKPVSWLLKKFGDRWFVPRSLVRKRDDIYDVECNVVQFHDERPRAFSIIVGITLLTHFLSVLEAWLAMRMLGLDVTWASAFIVESLTKAVNFVFFLIPGTVGAYEGGSSLIFTMLGYGAGAGVALALVRRGGILFWTLIGGVILLWRGAKQSAEQIVE
jgi:uncharacterized protein (TIRG00374 family)